MEQHKKLFNKHKATLSMIHRLRNDALRLEEKSDETYVEASLLANQGYYLESLRAYGQSDIDRQKSLTMQDSAESLLTWLEEELYKNNPIAQDEFWDLAYNYWRQLI